MSGLRFIALVGMIAFLGFLASPAPAAAQTQGSIVGIVTDTSGAVLPGVTVVVTGPALQVPQLEAVTNDRGEYRISPLPPGAFAITFELAGFQTVKRENLRLTLGFTATVDQAMGLGTVQETVTVSGQSPLVDVTNPATSVDMSSESLEILPTNRDGLKAFMGTMPGVRTNLDVGASSLSDTVVFRSVRAIRAVLADARGDHVLDAERRRSQRQSHRFQRSGFNARPDRGQQRRNAETRHDARRGDEVGWQRISW